MKRSSTFAFAVLLLTAVVSAQKTALDRTKAPPPRKPPTLVVPAWTSARLANGAELLVSERHTLPLVSFTIWFEGGANQYETAERRGLSLFVASMLSEGTKTRDGEALSNALQLLGTNVGVTISEETGSIGFVSTTPKFGATLDILADMLVNPVFPPDALERLRAQRLVGFAQAKTQPRAISSVVFPRVVYGDTHPLGQQPSERTAKAITRDDLVAFHKAFFQPAHAVVVVVGDVDARTVKATVDRALAAWPAGGSKPSFTYPPLPDKKPTTIFLVDRPGAAQSTFLIGNPGPPRSTPDYYALQVMNTILGGQFQSRLNANIREQKGYSYGVNSSFFYGKGPGPFRASGDIFTARSDAALVEFMKELRGIQGSRPITDEELQTAKDALIQRLPGTFGSVSGINSAIASLRLQGLPDTYYQTYASNVSAVTNDDVVRVAKQYIDLDHLAIVIVGDRAAIESGVKATGTAPIVALDVEGNPAK